MLIYFTLLRTLDFLFIFMAGWLCNRSLLHLFPDKMLGGKLLLVI